MIGVKVPMGQVVAHTRDVGPRDRRLLGEYLGIDALHRLADLDETNAHRVVDQPIGQGSSFEVSLLIARAAASTSRSRRSARLGLTAGSRHARSQPQPPVAVNVPEPHRPTCRATRPARGAARSTPATTSFRGDRRQGRRRCAARPDHTRPNRTAVGWWPHAGRPPRVGQRDGDVPVAQVGYRAERSSASRSRCRFYPRNP